MHLIRSELPKEFAAGYRWSLLSIKVCDGDNPYVAFESASAAAEFIATFPAPPTFSEIEFSCLGLDTYLRPNADALIFSSIGQLNEWRDGGMQKQIPRASILTKSAFVRIVRKTKDWHAAWHTRHLSHEDFPLERTTTFCTDRQFAALGVALVLNLVVPFVLFPHKWLVFEISPTLFWAFLELQTLVLPGISMWLLAKHYSVTPSLYGLPSPPKFNSDLVKLSLFVAFSIAAVYWPSSQLAWGLLKQYVDWPVATIHQVLPDGIARIPVATLLSFEAGLMESVIFIGWPWLLFGGRCNTFWRRVAFAVLSSLVFGANHSGNGIPGVIATFFFGLAAVACFLYIRNLWPVVFGHALVDLLSFG